MLLGSPQGWYERPLPLGALARYSLVSMYPRRPVLVVGLAVGILLAGTGAGLRATTSDPLAAGAEEMTAINVSTTAISTIDTEPVAAPATIDLVAKAPTLA